MNHADLPERWRLRLIEWIRKYSDDHREQLGASDFPCNYKVELKFSDESHAIFSYALVIEEPKLNEIGVFTEHCGYHIFPLYGTHVRRIED